MIPSVLMPDATRWAIEYLSGELAARSEAYTSNVHVAASVPSPRKDRMVIVRRDGGGRIDHLRESARLSVNVWAKSTQEVNDLARMVRALLWAAPDGDPVVRLDDLSGPSPIPDESGQPRVLLAVEAIVRGQDL